MTRSVGSVERVVSSVEDRGEFILAETGVSTDGLVGVPLELAAPSGCDDEDGDLARSIGQRRGVAHRGTERLHRHPESRLKQQRVEGTFQGAVVTDDLEEPWACGPRPLSDCGVDGPLVVVQVAGEKPLEPRSDADRIFIRLIHRGLEI